MQAGWEYATGHGPNKVYVEGEAPLTELRLAGWFKMKPMADGIWWLRVGDAWLMVFADDDRVSVEVIRGFYAEANGPIQQDEGTHGG